MKVVVIGGGVSGMMAAITASYHHDVLLLEQNKSLGQKLLMTGNGRCNVTNNKPISEFLLHCNRESRFLYSALTRFGPSDIIDYFTTRQVPLKQEDRGRMFPVSNRSHDILMALKRELNKVEVCYGCKVEGWVVSQNNITAVKTNQGVIACDHVILATGGASYPQTGSQGDGYSFLKSVGHTITPLYPAEVPLVCQDKVIQDKTLMGVSLQNCHVELIVNNKVVKHVKGDVLFTHFGLSGPAILEISEFVGADKTQLRLQFDLVKLPISAKEMGVPKGYYEWVKSQNPLDKPFEQLSKQQQTDILNGYRSQVFTIQGPLSLSKAIVTKGGVKVKEIDPKTMKSKIIDNLSICGELLDCHGSVGGYNITIALSSGYCAGEMI